MTVFNGAVGGDTIKLQGSFASITLQNRSFTSRVTIDATAASFTDTLSIRNVDNLTLTGGKYGSATAAMRSMRAIAVYNGSNITINKAAVTNIGTDMGITFAGTIRPTVTAVTFSGQRLGIGVTSVTDAKISSNSFSKLTSDGINVVDSQRVLVTANKCSGTIPSVGAHPDCIQLWSVAGKAMQSDITITNNIISGATQGLTSFDPSTASGTRITMTGNDIYTSYVQGIACYGCFDSVFMNNSLRTLSGASWRTSMNIVGGGGNTISNNTVAALGSYEASLSGSDDTPVASPVEPDWLDVSQFTESIPDALLADLALLDAQNAANRTAVDLSGLDSDSFANPAGMFGNNVAAVPEPAVWLQMLTGFGLAGVFARRRRVACA